MQKDFTCSMDEVSAILARGNKIRNESGLLFWIGFLLRKKNFIGELIV